MSVALPDRPVPSPAYGRPGLASLAPASDREAPRPRPLPRMSREDARALRKAMAPFARPSLRKSLVQVADTFIPFFACWALAYLSLEVSYALTFGFALLCAGLIVRMTILQHDSGHYAFFRSRWANEWMIRVISLFNFAPLCFWTRQHAYHHQKINSLDRGARDVFAECLTVREYLALPPRHRLIYRVTRDPFVFFWILAPLTMIIGARLPITAEKSWKAERRNLYRTNIALLVVYGGLIWALGFREFALVHGPIIVLASGFGFWLDFLGHKFPTAQWVHDEDWELPTTALNGCGYFKMNKVLQWFSGAIGIHHVHHINPRIPNYALQDCLDAVPALQAVPSFTVWQAVKSAWLVLWDEDRGRLIRFDEIRAPRPAPGAPPPRSPRRSGP